MKSCESIRRLLFRYDDGDLDEIARESVEEHLHSCPVCRRELNALRASLRAFKGLDPGAPPEASAPKSAEALVLNLSRVAKRRSRIRRIAAAAAVIVITLSAALLLVNLYRSQSPHGLSGEEDRGAAQLPDVEPLVTPPPAPPPYRASDADIEEALLNARLEAVKLAMAETEFEAETTASERTFVTIADLYDRVPAIMLAAADQMNYEMGLEEESAEQYERVASLFPRSRERVIALQRLEELSHKKNGG